MTSKASKRNGWGTSAIVKSFSGLAPVVYGRPGLRSKAVADHRTSCFERGLSNKEIQREQLSLFGVCNKRDTLSKKREAWEEQK